jgi:hypothetical protein
MIRRHRVRIAPLGIQRFGQPKSHLRTVRTAGKATPEVAAQVNHTVMRLGPNCRLQRRVGRLLS